MREYRTRIGNEQAAGVFGECVGGGAEGGGGCAEHARRRDVVESPIAVARERRGQRGERELVGPERAHELSCRDAAADL